MAKKTQKKYIFVSSYNDDGFQAYLGQDKGKTPQEAFDSFMADNKENILSMEDGEYVLSGEIDAIEVTTGTHKGVEVPEDYDEEDEEEV